MQVTRTLQDGEEGEAVLDVAAGKLLAEVAAVPLGRVCGEVDRS